MTDVSLQGAILRLTTGLTVNMFAEVIRATGLPLTDVLILGAVASLDPTASAKTRGSLTVHGLSESLSMPRETCRRRIVVMRERGWLSPDRERLTLGPQAILLLENPSYVDLIVAQARRTVASLRAAGVEI